MSCWLDGKVHSEFAWVRPLRHGLTPSTPAGFVSCGSPMINIKKWGHGPSDQHNLWALLLTPRRTQIQMRGLRGVVTPIAGIKPLNKIYWAVGRKLSARPRTSRKISGLVPANVTTIAVFRLTSYQTFWSAGVAGSDSGAGRVVGAGNGSRNENRRKEWSGGLPGREPISTWNASLLDGAMAPKILVNYGRTWS